MRQLIFALIGIITLTSAAAAQESYYTRQNRVKYQQALSRATTATNGANAVQAQLGTQRGWYNSGMRSRDWRVRNRAKQSFIIYLNRLQRGLLSAERAHGEAVYWGSRYARGLCQVRRTAAQGRLVWLQVGNLRNAQASLRATRLAVEGERAAVYRAR